MIFLTFTYPIIPVRLLIPRGTFFAFSFYSYDISYIHVPPHSCAAPNPPEEHFLHFPFILMIFLTFTYPLIPVRLLIPRGTFFAFSFYSYDISYIHVPPHSCAAPNPPRNIFCIFLLFLWYFLHSRTPHSYAAPNPPRNIFFIFLLFLWYFLHSRTPSFLCGS